MSDIGITLTTIDTILLRLFLASASMWALFSIVDIFIIWYEKDHEE